MREVGCPDEREEQIELKEWLRVGNKRRTRDQTVEQSILRLIGERTESDSSDERQRTKWEISKEDLVNEVEYFVRDLTLIVVGFKRKNTLSQTQLTVRARAILDLEETGFQEKKSELSRVGCLVEY